MTSSGSESPRTSAQRTGTGYSRDISRLAAMRSEMSNVQWERFLGVVLPYLDGSQDGQEWALVDNARGDELRYALQAAILCVVDSEDKLVRAQEQAGRGTVTTAHVLLTRDEGRSVWMLRRSGTGYMDGSWSLPAGHVELGESVVSAAVREVQEEAGVAVDPNDLTIEYSVHRKSDEVPGMPPARVDYFLRTDRWEGKPHLAERDKADAVGWYRLSALPESTIPYVTRALRAVTTYGPRLVEEGW